MKTDKIKILFIIDIIDEHHIIGGAELHTLDIINHLDKNKYNIYCVSDNGDYLDYLVRNMRHKISIKKVRRWKKIFLDPFYFFEINKAINEIKPHIIHTQKLKSSIWGRIAGKLQKTPAIISTLHGAPSLWKYSPLKNTANRIANAITANYFADLNITISEFEYDILTNKDWVTPLKTALVYNGIFDYGIYRFSYIRRNPPFRLICIGRLSWEKGHIYLIKAMKSIVKVMPDIHLFIIGDGKEKDNLNKETMRYGLQKNIHFVGYIDRNNIPNILSKSDLFILPSLWEALPYTIIEAMFSALPVVATKTGGIPELIINNKGGLLVNPQKENELSYAILKMLNNYEMRKKCSIFNKKRSLKLFKGEDMIKKLENLYINTLNKKGI